MLNTILAKSFMSIHNKKTLNEKNKFEKLTISLHCDFYKRNQPRELVLLFIWEESFYYYLN